LLLPDLRCFLSLLFHQLHSVSALLSGDDGQVVPLGSLLLLLHHVENVLGQVSDVLKKGKAEFLVSDAICPGYYPSSADQTAMRSTAMVGGLRGNDVTHSRVGGPLVLGEISVDDLLLARSSDSVVTVVTLSSGESAKSLVDEEHSCTRARAEKGT
jgi:hypothetical protein